MGYCNSLEKAMAPTPVLLPGKSHGQRSPEGWSPWGREESDTTERLHFHFHFHALEKEMATYSSVLAWSMTIPKFPFCSLQKGSSSLYAGSFFYKINL